MVCSVYACSGKTQFPAAPDGISRNWEVLSLYEHLCTVIIRNRTTEEQRQPSSTTVIQSCLIVAHFSFFISFFLVPFIPFTVTN